MSNQTPEVCKSCRHRYNDMQEGQNCRKLDRRIVLASGDSMSWPGWAVSEAIADCQGKLAEPRMFGKLAYYSGC